MLRSTDGDHRPRAVSSDLQAHKPLVYITDAENRFALVNLQFEKTFCLSAGHAYGKPVDDLFAHDFALAHRASATAVLAAREPATTQETIRVNGRPHTWLIHRFPLEVTNGDWSGVVCFAIDLSTHSDGPPRRTQLRAAERRLKACAVLLLDPQGNITGWTDSARRLFGYAANKAMNRPVSMLYADANMSSRLLNSAASKHTHRTEAWRVSRDGTRFPAIVDIGTLLNSSGQAEGFVEVDEKLPDTTEAQQELSESAESSPPTTTQETEAFELNRAILSSLSAHIAVLDHHGDILQVNAAWERFAVENGAPHLAHPEDGLNYLDVCRRASGPYGNEAADALAGVSGVLNGSARQFDLEYPCHSPTTERWFLMTVVPLRIDGGGAVVSHTDITERVVAENERRRTYEFFRALVENASDIVIILDGNGVIRYQSASVGRALGYSRHELDGRPVFDLLSPEQVPYVRETIAALTGARNGTVPLEHVFLHKDGTWRVLGGVATNALDNPAVNGIIINSRDVTERRHAEAELRAKEAALRGSHHSLQSMTMRLLEAEETERRRISRELHDDLNQKLAILAVDVGGLARALPAEDPVHAAGELRTLQARLTAICGQVRTMAYQLHPSILDDLGLVVAVRSWCAEFSRRESIRVKFVARNVSEPVAHDISAGVYRIAQEALRNVAKHSAAKTATVSLIGSAKHISLSVRDPGQGFDVVGATRTGGLGLTSMEERARMLGGSFTIESIQGKGTSVVVTFPWSRDSL